MNTQIRQPSFILFGIRSHLSTVLIEVTAKDTPVAFQKASTENARAPNVPASVQEVMEELAQTVPIPEYPLPQGASEKLQNVFSQLDILKNAFEVAESGKGTVTEEMVRTANGAETFLKELPGTLEIAFTFLEQFRTDEERRRESIGEFYNIEQIKNYLLKITTPEFQEKLKTLPAVLKAMRQTSPPFSGLVS